MNRLRAAVIQHHYTGPADTAHNLYQQLKSAKAQGAQLALLPELHHHPYFCQTQNTRHFERAEPIPGPSSTQLSQWAQQLSLLLIGSLFEKRMPGVYHNTALVVDTDGSLAGCYRKMHIPDDPGFNEKFYFTPGDATPGFQPIQTSLGKLGVMICWDQWYPEAARLMALSGAEMLLYPTAIGWDPNDTPEEQTRQQDAWRTIQRSHAIANHIPVLSANRWGHEADPCAQTQGIHFWGNSFIAGSQGEYLAQAEHQKDEVLMAELPLATTETLRQTWPFFRDRRVDAYTGLTNRSPSTRLKTNQAHH